jgi:hypothetical protein
MRHVTRKRRFPVNSASVNSLVNAINATKRVKTTITRITTSALAAAAMSNGNQQRDVTNDKSRAMNQI